jgi:hypothetical protein
MLVSMDLEMDAVLNSQRSKLLLITLGSDQVAVKTNCGMLGSFEYRF